MGRNGRLNVWECDTPLNGLVIKPKSNTVEEIGVDGDELASTKKNVDLNDDLTEKKDGDEDDMDAEDNQDVKLTIHYKKVAK